MKIAKPTLALKHIAYLMRIKAKGFQLQRKGHFSGKILKNDKLYSKNEEHKYCSKGVSRTLYTILALTDFQAITLTPSVFSLMEIHAFFQIIWN